MNYRSALRYIPAPAKAFLRRRFGDSLARRKMDHYNEDFPKSINISFMEKTCMFSCTMCPYHEQDVRDLYNVKSEMSFETLKNLVAGVPNRSDITFDMSNIGETLEFKPLPEFIAYMKKERPLVQTIVSTNIVMMNEALFRALAKAGLDHIQLSLYAQNAHDHHAITGSRSFERCCENIRTAARVKKELGLTKPLLKVFMMEAMETRHHVEEFVQYWSPYVDEAFARPIYNVAREIKGLTPVFGGADFANRYPCVTPWYSVAVRSNGDVLGCYIFHWDGESKDIVLGNVNEKPLGEIFRGETFQHLRRAHLEQKLADYKACQTCDLWEAYANVFRKDTDGTFHYTPVTVADFFRHAPQRGG
jgi:MoaA/NifB/PqqE/SkfB family radical SAM enzyme